MIIALATYLQLFVISLWGELILFICWWFVMCPGNPGGGGAIGWVGDLWLETFQSEEDTLGEFELYKTLLSWGSDCSQWPGKCGLCIWRYEEMFGWITCDPVLCNMRGCVWASEGGWVVARLEILWGRDDDIIAGSSAVQSLQGPAPFQTVKEIYNLKNKFVNIFWIVT